MYVNVHVKLYTYRHAHTNTCTRYKHSVCMNLLKANISKHNLRFWVLFLGV